MNREKYNWAAYYRHAYEREKKKTAQLAGKLFEAENKLDELRVKYARLTGSFVWKCLAPFRLVRRAGRKIKRLATERRAIGAPRIDPERYQEILGQYHTELSRQSDPYSEWLAQKEPGLKAEALHECGVSSEEAKKLCRVIAYREIGSLSDELMQGEPELILFAEEKECLDADAPRLALACMRAHPEAVFWYEDVCVETAGGQKRCHPYFKPDWSPETLLGFFYFGSYVGIRASVLQAALRQYGQYDRQYSDQERLYAICLSIAFGDPCGPAVGAACRTSLVLYTGKYREHYEETILETTNSENYEQYGNYWGYERDYLPIKEACLSHAGYLPQDMAVCPGGPFKDVWSVYPLGDSRILPKVSVVIPSKDNPGVLEKCISSFLEKTDYAEKKLEFLVVDNGSAPENRAQVERYLNGLKEHPLVSRTEYLYEKADFNFSKMCNVGARAATGELILLLNDDIEIIVDNWLRIMVGQTFFPGTGAVGAKLWYPACERIQHAGITNLAIGPSHKLITFPDDRLYYYGHGAVSMNMIAVTAACLLVKKSVYAELGGLNENLAVAYNDVEFCFRLLRNGYRNVQRNDAVLCHHESLSRGRDDLSDEKWDRLLSEKKKLYDLYPEYKGADPYYSPFLTQNSPEYVTGYEYPFEDRLFTAECCKVVPWKQLRRAVSDQLKLTLERVLFQRKFHGEEPDILMAEGWCYLPGADNALYTVFFLLHAESGDGKARLYPVNVRYRYDVCAILPHETNVGLAGFTCRVRKADLEPGTYRAGLLYRHKITEQEICTESEFTVAV